MFPPLAPSVFSCLHLQSSQSTPAPPPPANSPTPPTPPPHYPTLTCPLFPIGQDVLWYTSCYTRQRALGNCAVLRTVCTRRRAALRIERRAARALLRPPARALGENDGAAFFIFSTRGRHRRRTAPSVFGCRTTCTTTAGVAYRSWCRLCAAFIHAYLRTHIARDERTLRYAYHCFAAPLFVIALRRTPWFA